MSFAATDPQNHQSENTWFTPKRFFDALGEFDIDPCTMSFRPFDTAKKHIDRDKGECGLSIEWSGDVWLNPPYGKEIKPFIDKFIKHRKGVCLIFARMGSQAIQDLLIAGAHFHFLRKRIAFINKNGVASTNAGTDSCLIFFEEKWIEPVNKLAGVTFRNGPY